MTGAPGTGVAPAERLARAALTRVAEPPLGSLIRLVERVGAEQAWAEVRSGRADLPDDVVARLVVRARETRPERDLERVESLGGRLICPGDSDWPAALEVLDAVAAAPLALWVRGPASLAEATGAAVALVGARAATDYGTHIAAELAAGLADRC
ncbi:MAG TPA: DNA-processing protein DprA, partial [Mycobacteriales bacterium]|nr:DNA-processing protein DprA [Mycobacteriales bacterium]